MAALGFLSIFVVSLAVVNCVTLSTHINNADKDRFISVFNSPHNDVKSFYYASLGLDSFSTKFSDSSKVCDILKKNLDTEQLSNVYHVAVVLKKLKQDGTQCQVDLKNSVNVLTSALKEGASSLHLLFAIGGLSALSQPIPQSADQLLKAALKADDSVQSQSYAIYAASHLRGDLKFFTDLIEDVIAQADEVDDDYLQFEGGLKSTALVLYASHLLATNANIKSPLPNDKALKFAKYLLLRKHVTMLPEASLLVSALRALASQKDSQLLSISLASSVAVSSASPIVSVKVCDIFGGKVEGLSLMADTARHISDNAVILSKQPFTLSKTQQSLFELDLMSLKPAVGFYKFLVSAASSNKKVTLSGGQDAQVLVKVITDAKVTDVELSISDKEQGTILNSWKVGHGEKVGAEGDYHQKVIIKFSVVDPLGAFLQVHQTFVRLLNIKTGHEVIYVAELDGTSAYKFDLDIGGRAKDFHGQTGKYQVDLVVGDAVLDHSIVWTLAELKLKFFEEITSAALQTGKLYSPKEEIHHVFRQPEKRPPSVVSTVFTTLTLLPLLILLILWLKIGANVSALKFSLSAIIFHVGLGGIFGLYFLYFLRFNMFETIKYLSIISLPTFFFGHRLLSSIANKKK